MAFEQLMAEAALKKGKDDKKDKKAKKDTSGADISHHHGHTHKSEEKA